MATERDTVQFKLNEDTFYTVEELLAMLLNNSRNLASDFAQDYVTSAIVTVPAYFTQAERRAVKNAVEIWLVVFSSCSLDMETDRLA